jgi:hypothetical protein
MTRDHTRYVHRINLGHIDREDFEFTGQVWEDLNPDWRVTNWTLTEARQDFPSLERIMRILEPYPDRLEVILGMALVVKWGGLYAGSHLEPTRSLPAQMPASPWMLDEHLFGAEMPEDRYWSDLLSECLRPYINHLSDSNLTHLFRSHSLGQLRLMPSMQSVIA